jgi:hypothetical protein
LAASAVAVILPSSLRWRKMFLSMWSITQKSYSSSSDPREV